MPDEIQAYSEPDVNRRRTTEEIRRDIDEGKEAISDTVNQLTNKIHDKLDWREYVKDNPVAVLGASVGLGFLAALVFVPRRGPVDRLIDELRDMRTDMRSAGSRAFGGGQQQGIIAGTLMGFATKAAHDWISNLITPSGAEHNRERVSAPQGTAVRDMPSQTRFRK